MSDRQTLETRYFDALYEKDADPWRFETSPYEHAKYAATIAALGGRQYTNAFEVGCSIGVLTARLAAKADRLLAVDCAARALAIAADRCRTTPHIVFPIAPCRPFPPAARLT